MNSDVGMHHAKNSGNKKSSTIKDTSTIMRNPLSEYVGGGGGGYA